MSNEKPFNGPFRYSELPKNWTYAGTVVPHAQLNIDRQEGEFTVYKNPKGESFRVTFQDGGVSVEPYNGPIDLPAPLPLKKAIPTIKVRL